MREKEMGEMHLSRSLFLCLLPIVLGRMKTGEFYVYNNEKVEGILPHWISILSILITGSCGYVPHTER